MQESTADVPGRAGKQDESVAALFWARRGQGELLSNASINAT
jgi:hypothetical protein